MALRGGHLDASATGVEEPESGMKSHAQAAVIGGGVVGCSILFHPAKMGWKDVVPLERKKLTSGSSWHAAGVIHTINADPNIARLQEYTRTYHVEDWPARSRD